MSDENKTKSTIVDLFIKKLEKEVNKEKDEETLAIEDMVDLELSLISGG